MFTFATTNKNKIKEMRVLFPEGFQTLADFPHFQIEPADETGSTFEENAIDKARDYAATLKVPILAEDSGLEVFALEDAPGVRSQRVSDDKIGWLLDKMKGFRVVREARYVSVMVFMPDYKSDLFIVSRGEQYGLIALKPRGKNGFDYDPLFLPEGYDSMTLGEISLEDKCKISHRAMAMKAMRKYLVEA